VPECCTSLDEMCFSSGWGTAMNAMSVVAFFSCSISFSFLWVARFSLNFYVNPARIDLFCASFLNTMCN
jgi:hypothetical protein